MVKPIKGIITWFMNHLTYIQKYYVAGVVRGIGFFILWFSLYFLTSNQLVLIEAEISNSAVQKNLQQLYEIVLLHKIAVQEHQDSLESINDKLISYHAESKNQLGLLKSFEANIQKILEDQKPKFATDPDITTLAQVEKRWMGIMERTLNNNQSELVADHNELLLEIKNLMESYADVSTLSMSPLNVSYLLMENIQRRLRESQTMIREAEEIVSRSINQEALTDEDRLQLRGITLFLTRNVQMTQDELTKVRFQLNNKKEFEEFLKQLRTVSYQYRIAADDFINIIENEVLTNPQQEFLEAAVLVDGSDTLGNSYALWDVISGMLKLILHSQKSVLWTRMLYIFVTAIILTFLGSYLGVHFVYEAIKCFRNLDNATRRFTRGDLSVRVPIIYKEEIGQASQAFNQMADHLQKLITEQRKLFKASKNMAEGNFSARVEIDEYGDEEINQVSISFNNMAQSFEEIVRQLHRLGINLTTSANEIASASKHQETLIVEQGDATQEISITASEISTTAKDFAITINDVSEVAEATSNLASDGQDSLVKMEQIMRQMVNASSNIAAKLSKLNEKASNITKIITTITNVARQTNLLSLNAAIEAEKTGKYSREFSGIAREIRRLADQTGVATLDIERIVNEIVEAVQICVTGVEDFTQEIHYGVEQVGNIGEQLGTIIVQVQALAFRFESVNEGMQSQSRSAEMINERMVQLSSTASETTESIHRFRNTIDQLSISADDLGKMITDINIDVSESRRGP